MLNARQAATLAELYPELAADSGFLDQLAANASAATLKAGQAICSPGDQCERLALVTAGSARVYKLAASGREITLYRIEPGECCILTASCLLSRRSFPADATVERDLEAILIPAPRVIEWTRTHEVWRDFLWGLLAARLADVIGLVEEVAFRRMDMRLADYLGNHVEQHDTTLHTTHGQIAADLGTSREVVSRLLKDLEQKGLVVLSRGRIDVSDTAGLRDFQQQCD